MKGAGPSARERTVLLIGEPWATVRLIVGLVVSGGILALTTYAWVTRQPAAWLYLPLVVANVAIVAEAVLLPLAGSLRTRVRVTERRITVDRGWIPRHRIDRPLQSISTVEAEANGVERLLGYGTVRLAFGAGKDSDDLLLRVARPAAVRDVIRGYASSGTAAEPQAG